MLKRTIVISNQAFIKKENDQLSIKQGEEEHTVPIEDVGVLMLDSPQISLTQPVISALLANDAVIINCNYTHHPDGIMTPISGNALHSSILKVQLKASIPLCKQLWQQTVKEKILNQSALLEAVGADPKPLQYWARKIRSGDPDNYEGRAAKHYWQHLFPPELFFSREREGKPPNNLLNYGYAILRASVARAVVSSGLHPAIGIHHKNQYNAFCLADDLMEPYRPFVDALVRKIATSGEQADELSPALKKELLSLLTSDVTMDGERKPLMTALSTTTRSLVSCYAKEARTIKYPRYAV